MCRMSTRSDLAGRVTLITGASRRIGAALARACHADGASVVLHFHRSGAQAKQLCEEMNAARPASATTVGADLLDAAALPALVRTAVDAFGRLDILVNNASSFYPTPVGSATTAQWDDLFGTNVRAPFFLAQAAAPELKRARGLIVNMIDIHAQR